MKLVFVQQKLYEMFPSIPVNNGIKTYHPLIIILAPVSFLGVQEYVCMLLRPASKYEFNCSVQQ